MTVSRGYGVVIAYSFGIEGPPTLRSRGFLSAQLAVSRISLTQAQLGLTPRIPPEDTFILAHYLTAVPHHELFSHGQPVLSRHYDLGSMRAVHLSGEYSAHVTVPHETQAFYLPRAALDELADEAEMRRIGTLDYPAGAIDPVLHHLAMALLPSLTRPCEADRLFVDHLLSAVAVHLMRHYGDAVIVRTPAKGGLSPYLAERAKEFLADQCERDVSLAEVASHCGLSRGHFAKAFRATVGMTPHRWRQCYRIDKAKKMLSTDDQPIADIALTCGFADQSHFTRVFGRMVGEGPASWRRRHCRRI